MNDLPGKIKDNETSLEIEKMIKKRDIEIYYAFDDLQKLMKFKNKQAIRIQIDKIHKIKEFQHLKQS
jgi:hypothetical protein